MRSAGPCRRSRRGTRATPRPRPRASTASPSRRRRPRYGRRGSPRACRWRRRASDAARSSLRPSRPRILPVSFATFSSSFGMKGTRLSTMSRPSTPPARPAPEMRLHGRHDHALHAERVDEGLQRHHEADRRAVRLRQRRSPSSRAPSAGARRAGSARPCSRPARAPACRPRSGTRTRDESVGVAFANFGSSSRAASASMQREDQVDRRRGRSSTRPARRASARRPRARRLSHQSRAPFSERMASAYGLPAVRAEAASVVTVNHGCPSKATSACWPAIPVAPTTATRSCFIGASFPRQSGGRVKRRRRLGRGAATCCGRRAGRRPFRPERSGASGRRPVGPRPCRSARRRGRSPAAR